MEMRQANQFSMSAVNKSGKSATIDLIRQIRIIEGNYACFGTVGSAGCSQGNCPWRRDCLNVAR